MNALPGCEITVKVHEDKGIPRNYTKSRKKGDKPPRKKTRTTTKIHWLKFSLIKESEKKH